MIDVSQDIHSLTDFKRTTPKFMKRLQATGNALLLTVNGKAELAVMSASTFQGVLDALDELDAIRGIRRGLEQAGRGDGVSLDEFDARVRRTNDPQGRTDQ